MNADTGPRDQDVAGPSLLEICSMLLRFPWLTIGLPLGLILITGSVGLVLPRTYTSTAAFLPQSGQSTLGRLAGLAAQLGVNVPGQNPGDSPEFYADLVVSSEVLTAIVADTLPVAPGEASQSLTTLLRAKGETREAMLQDAVRRLRREVGVGIDPKTGLVSISITTRWPAVSASIIDRIVMQVNEFELRIKQAQASSERTFIESRLNDAQAELRAAEDRQERFLATNREYRNSPALQAQFDRITREISAHQEVVTTLRQGYEQARIDEVRDTPRVTVIERPVVAARPDSRRLVFKVLLAGLVGVVLGWPAALMVEFLRRVRLTERNEFETVATLVRGLLPARLRTRTPTS